MEIEELINQGLQGNEKALNQLYSIYSHKMVGICVKIVGNHMIAEELAHDAFILAISKLDQLQNPKRFDSWLSCITSNVARRYLEQHRNTQTVPFSQISEDEIHQIEQSENAPMPPLPPLETILSAIDSLPNGYSKVFRMSVIQEMSHAEIANILGIAAHSSSSQLARAKKMLRKMLANYWSLLLLLLISLPFIYLFVRQSNETSTPIATSSPTSKQKDLSISNRIDTNQLPIDTIKSIIPIRIKTNDVRIAANHQSLPQKHTEEDSIISPSTITTIDSSIFLTDQPIDSVVVDSISLPDFEPQTFLAQQDVEPIISNDNNSSWNVNLSYIENIYGTSPWSDMVYYDHLHFPDSEDSFNLDMWSGISSYVDNANYPEEERTAIKEIAQYHIRRGKRVADRSDNHNMPFTISMATQYRFNNHLGIESGLSYTLLSSQFITGESNVGIIENQKIHYLGIPLKVSYTWLNSKHWDIYSSAGFTFEFPVNATFLTDYRLHKSLYFKTESFKAPCQWSVSLGAGVQYNIGSHFGIFIEPNAQYFIPNGSEIETYRTEHPFAITLPIGVRCRW